MGRSWSLIGIITCAFVATAARAETLFQTDFTAASADAINAAWELNGVARIVEAPDEKPSPRLRLSHGEFAESGSAWYKMPFQLSSFTAQFDVRFRRQTEGNVTPGDGLAFAFADVPATFLGDAGGALGLYAGDSRLTPGQVFGLDINIYAGEGIGFALSGARPPIEDRPGWTTLPAGVKLVDGGVWRFTLRVTPAGSNSHAEVFLEGGSGKLARTKIADYTSDSPALPAMGRFGFTAATGGATEFTDVYGVTVIAPAAGP